MHFSRSTFLFVSLALLSVRATGGEQAAPLPTAEKLTLPAALAEAFAQSPALQIINAEVESARGDVVTSTTRPPPELTVSPNLRRLKESDGTRHEFLGSIALSQTFSFPGKRQLLIAIAERNVALRELAIEGLRFQVAATVRKAFYEVLATQSGVRLRHEQLSSAQAFADAAARRAEAGYASDFEAVKSQGDIITARKLLAQAESDVVAAQVELNLMLGRPAAAPLEAAGAVEVAASEPPLADLIQRALDQNPGLRVQALQAEIATMNLRKARLARKPDVSVGPSLEWSRSEQIVGLSATVPLPGKNYGRGEILSASAEQRRVAAQAEQLRREISGEVARAATQLIAARQQLTLSSPEYLDRLKAIVQQAEQSFARNETSLLLYLDAKRTYFDALADRNEAIANVARARAALEAAVGVSLDPTATAP